MGIIVWIVFGGLAGWVGSMIMGTDGQQGILLNVIVGIVGASLGGFIMNFFGEGVLVVLISTVSWLQLLEL